MDTTSTSNPNLSTMEARPQLGDLMEAMGALSVKEWSISGTGSSGKGFNNGSGGGPQNRNNFRDNRPRLKSEEKERSESTESSEPKKVEDNNTGKYESARRENREDGAVATSGTAPSGPERINDSRGVLR
uniref:Uncharacterized protein n=1 Tax=Ditylenchus dipsaci TaxID=166011 RepID=A0A915CQH3_9BILA